MGGEVSQTVPIANPPFPLFYLALLKSTNVKDEAVLNAARQLVVDWGYDLDQADADALREHKFKYAREDLKHARLAVVGCWAWEILCVSAVIIIILAGGLKDWLSLLIWTAAGLVTLSSIRRAQRNLRLARSLHNATLHAPL